MNRDAKFVRGEIKDLFAAAGVLARKSCFCNVIFGEIKDLFAAAGVLAKENFQLADARIKMARLEISSLPRASLQAKKPLLRKYFFCCLPLACPQAASESNQQKKQR